MTNISNAFIISNNADITTQNKKGNQAVGSSQFDALLANADSQAELKELAGTLIENIMRSLDNTLNNLITPDTDTSTTAKNSVAFPFSSEFESVFGTSGPLFDFINVTTARLNLNEEQNQALQNIAINNKDITLTPANVQKVADELKQAGIW